MSAVFTLQPLTTQQPPGLFMLASPCPEGKKKGGMGGSEAATQANWEPHLTQVSALMSDTSPDVTLWAEEIV